MAVWTLGGAGRRPLESVILRRRSTRAVIARDAKVPGNTFNHGSLPSRDPRSRGPRPASRLTPMSALSARQGLDGGVKFNRADLNGPDLPLTRRLATLG
jgi:hypothetical protein